MADYKVERAIELEQGLINLQPIPAGKMGLSHDARSLCVVVRAASVVTHWRGPRSFIAESQGECKEKVQKPQKTRPTITGDSNC